MNYFKQNTVIFFFLFIISPFISSSQVILSKSVISNGGSVSASNGIKLSSTVGQAVIGRGPSDHLIYEIGFWYGLKTNLSTSIDEISEGSIDEQLNLTISPNPVSTISRLQYSLKAKTKVNIKLTSLTGKAFLDIDKGHQNKGHYSQDIDMTDLPVGMYICRLTTPKGYQNLKVINL